MILGVVCSAFCGLVTGQAAEGSLNELKVAGALRSSYRTPDVARAPTVAPTADLDAYRKDIEPILAKACYGCHGPDKQKGELRIDTLNADLFAGRDVDWWLEVLAVLSNGEMPPEDSDVELQEADRSQVVVWLASEIQLASSVRRATTKHSSFRRMTRYEYNYALQDLLGLPYDFAGDLPPDPSSKDGFENSSEVLHMMGVQFRAYLDAGRMALRLATVSGERPEPIFWGVSMSAAAAGEWQKQDQQLANIREKHKDDPAKMEAELHLQTKRLANRPNAAYYLKRGNHQDRVARQSWGYDGAKFAFAPTTSLPELSTAWDCVAVLPPSKGLIVELGDQIPDSGTLRVRVRATRASASAGPAPSMRLLFGWQASNDSSSVVQIPVPELTVEAAPSEPQFYEWHVPVSQIYPRNLMRGVTKMGDLPSPSEYLRLVNASLSGEAIEVHYVEVTANFYAQWPPSSHQRIFGDRGDAASEQEYAREVLTRFLGRAWRREATAEELDQKLALLQRLRPDCDSFEDAMVEVLATVLASPNFLYLGQATTAPGQATAGAKSRVTGQELATRLSMFLWCSTPDQELIALASSGQLCAPEVLGEQVQRLLADPKARRLSEQFVRQWLGLELLDFLHVDRKLYPQFEDALQAAMREEPVAFFQELLQGNLSVLEFLHSDFTMANELLAKHYGLRGVIGNDFRRVALEQEHRRGGLLTQAGLLAMNSDGVDSHPLKRGIWMLERLLNDPPPPPPPAVPEIDLADPEIAKMTLKQRIENHRNAPACMSCHAKIDPWGIAFESFDAIGNFRTEIKGQPVDAVSYLFNKQKLDGVDGLKRFLLINRQDQFVRALVYKLTTFALGRPLTFGDHAAIDEIAAETRKRGDGLASMVTAIATSRLFQSK